MRFKDRRWNIVLISLLVEMGNRLLMHVSAREKQENMTTRSQL